MGGGGRSFQPQKAGSSPFLAITVLCTFVWLSQKSKKRKLTLAPLLPGRGGGKRHIARSIERAPIVWKVLGSYPGQAPWGSLRWAIFFFRDYFRGIYTYSILFWHRTGCALMRGGRSIFPHCFCSAKEPSGCPGPESNPGPTERQAGALTIELRLTPPLSYASPQHWATLSNWWG